MQILNLVQGSPEWKAERFKGFTASEAPIMMGASPYMSRDDLLKYKTTGDEQEISRFTQIIFDKGHMLEAKARPIGESRHGEDFFPVTGLVIIDSMRILASFDGLTMPGHEIVWEHKQFNKELYELVSSGGELDPKHYWQLEQQALVSEAETIIFAVSDGTEENYVDCIYESRPERRAELIASWKQFAIDLQNYVPIVYEASPLPRVIEQLPALAIQLVGEVKQSNIALYERSAIAFIRNINKDLKTDQDFVDADAAVKFLDNMEKELELVKKQALSQTADIAALFMKLDQIQAESKPVRLSLGKLIAKRKEEIKEEVISSVNSIWSEHLRVINEGIAPIRMPVIAVDFRGAIKNKRTIKSLTESANTELARAKVEATRIEEIIVANVVMMREIASTHTFLFADRQNLMAMDQEALRAIALQRIDTHDKEQQRLAEVKRIADEKAAAEEKRIADEKAEQERAAAETKRLADEQIAKNNAATAQRQASEPAVQPKAIARSYVGGASIPRDLPPAVPSASAEEYDEMAAIATPEFEQQFMEVFTSDAAEPGQESFVDMSDFHAGLIAGFEQSIRKFDDCLRTGQDFKTAMHNLIAANKLPAKAA